MTTLLDAVDANVPGGDGVTTDGGNKTVAIWADDFDSGTVTLQGSPDGGTTWITLTIAGSPAAFTSNTIQMIDRLGQGMKVRAILTGSLGSASNVSAKLFD